MVTPLWGPSAQRYDRVYAEGASVFRVRRKSGGGNHRLAGRTAEIYAGTPEMLAFKQHHLMTCVCEGAGKGDASLARTNNRCLCLDRLHSDARNGLARSRLSGWRSSES